MKLGYDNIEDAKTKLKETYCLYDGKAIIVKGVHIADNADFDTGKYTVTAAYMTTGKSFGPFPIDDPKFNCSQYNLGYVNRLHSASWYYRVPMKQYKQGLRFDQIGARASQKAFYGHDFKPGKPVANMLEGVYPNFHQGVQALRDQEAAIVAFHRNFAMTLDVIHDDFIIEYKGENIGFTRNLEDFKIMKQHEHLYESLKEAAG